MATTASLSGATHAERPVLPLVGGMRSRVLSDAVVLVGLALLLAPVFFDLATEIWSTEQGSQGPIVLATGIWLFVREWPRQATGPGRLAIALPLLLPVLLLYLFGQVTGILWMAWVGGYSAALIVLYDRFGTAGLVRLWFPAAYLLLLVPPPHLVTGAVVNALNAALSSTAVDLMWAMGFEVSQDGAMLYIDQYELHMAEACAGLGSLFSLFALSMLYIYLRHRTEWRYATLLALFVPPIAILANLGRILLLMMATATLGDSTAQGVFHPLAGLVMFVIALSLLIAIDALLTPLRKRLSAEPDGRPSDG